jgi:hypothetical protein
MNYITLQTIKNGFRIKMSQEIIEKIFRDKYLKSLSHNYNRISELEWLLIPEDLRQEYLAIQINNETLLPDFILKSLPESSMNKYIYNMIRAGYLPQELGLKARDLPEELLKRHISIIIGENSVEDDLFDMFTEEQKYKHINNSGERSYSITEYQFNYLNPMQKVDYLVYNQNSYTDFMINWYKSWREAIDREKRMDSILN